MIEVSKLKKVYGETVAVHIEQLHVAKGESIGLIGNNGAGKTTFFRLILDLLKPTEGTVAINGKTVDAGDWKSYTGSFLDEGFLIDHLTPEEYFHFIAKVNGIGKEALEEKMAKYEVLFNGEILGNKKKYLRDLSKGNMKKVGIAAALMTDPELLVLDEPFANLDPSSQIRLKRMLNEQQGKITMLISSHDLNHVTEVCRRTLIMQKGEVIRDFATTPDTLRELEDYFSEGVEGEGF